MYRQSGQSHIPLRVNSAGMIPLIFAFSIVILPSLGAQYFQTSGPRGSATRANFVNNVFSPGQTTGGGASSGSIGFYFAIFFLVVIFSFFYTLVVFQQQNLAENLQKQGGFVPGIRPGRPTGEYIMRVLVRITWAGAIFLGVVAVIPYLATSWFGITSLQISSTGLLIVVGVVHRHDEAARSAAADAKLRRVHTVGVRHLLRAPRASARARRRRSSPSAWRGCTSPRATCCARTSAKAPSSGARRRRTWTRAC